MYSVTPDYWTTWRPDELHAAQPLLDPFVLSPRLKGDQVHAPFPKKDHNRFLSWTHIKRQATRHDCLPGLLDDGDPWNEIMYYEKTIFCTGPTRAAKAGQKSLVPARRAQRTNQGRNPLYSFQSPFAQFRQSAGSTPLLSSLVIIHSWKSSSLRHCLSI
jgi:hypothetical protein